MKNNQAKLTLGAAGLTRGSGRGPAIADPPPAALGSPGKECSLQLGRCSDRSEAASLMGENRKQWKRVGEAVNRLCGARELRRGPTFRQRLDGVHDGLRDAHLLDANVCWVEEHLRDGKALVGQPQDLLSGLVFSTEDHLLPRLGGRERDGTMRAGAVFCQVKPDLDL